MSGREYRGILFIGDPHLASRIPGFRKDDYPRTALRKLAWCLDYAAAEALLPAILGDIFDRPRDNANWLLGELIALLGRHPAIGIHGNHDCRENTLMDDDSLSVIVRARRLHLVDQAGPWQGMMNGRPVVIGGTAWGQRLPERYATDGASRPLVFWMIHHDVIVPGYEEQGRFRPREVPGIDVMVNGHVHRRLEDVRTGATTWLTPGNIMRIKRSDAGRQHTPAALRVDIEPDGWRQERVVVPHEPFDAVFHAEVIPEAVDGVRSAFVQGLAELQARRTESGAGLEQFLEQNLGQFEPAIAEEIRRLAKEVVEHGDE